ncbi:MAG: helix-turn-helix transcriptional regulator [Planctomycetes bacterium]|nr:helix-turn-helix transcriptional regulator [Planctomycetota bacterium]
MSAEWFAGRLRELRSQAGLTQEQLAEKVGVKRDAIARWERGSREPSWSNVVALVNALGVDANAFLQEPVTPPPAGPGRPRKAPAESAEQQQPKRPRGRPRKAPAAVQEATSEGKASEGAVGSEEARHERWSGTEGQEGNNRRRKVKVTTRRRLLLGRDCV